MAQRSSVTWRVVDGEALIVDLHTGDYFSLNPVATDIWERLHVGVEPAEIVADIAEKHGIDAATVGADLDDLLAQLREARLVR
jgi:hypothetical protein